MGVKFCQTELFVECGRVGLEEAKVGGTCACVWRENM